MTTQKPISKSPISDAFLSKNAEGNYLSNGCFCAGCGNNTSFIFTGKEKDPETGYSYFGARYLEHDLMTGWLSVDPMSDKYPSLSPYAYCAWNPVRLIDPEGEDTAFAGDYERKMYNEYREMVFSDNQYSAIQAELLNLESAEEVFFIQYGPVIDEEESGHFTYNPETKQFEIYINDSKRWTNIEKLSHELKHADQYLNRKLIIRMRPSGDFFLSYYSIDDELEAYHRQEMFGDSFSEKKVFEEYKELDYHGYNDVFKPTDDIKNANIQSQQHYGHPVFLYHGWQKDLKK